MKAGKFYPFDNLKIPVMNPIHFRSLLLFAFLFPVSFVHAQFWSQKGTDIEGKSYMERFGWCVNMPDPNTVAIGAEGNDATGDEAGHVRVYGWSGTAWVQKGGDINGEAPEDRSGTAVCMPDANTIAIGAHLNDGAGLNAGHVRVYVLGAMGKWTQKGLDIEGDTATDAFGMSLSMPDANTILIAASGKKIPGTFVQGYLKVYEWSGSAWVKKGATILGPLNNYGSGSSVSMPDANTLAIGAPRDNTAGICSGSVRVFEWSGTDWVLKGAEIYGEELGDESGYSVSMPDASTVAIGAPENNDAGFPGVGQVRVYNWSGSAWVQKGGDIDGEVIDTSTVWSGRSVSMPDANTLAIGAPNHDGNGTAAGQVRIYSWDGMAWVQKGIDMKGEYAYDFIGCSVSMPDLNTVAIGESYNHGGGYERGRVRIYSFTCDINTDVLISGFTLTAVQGPPAEYQWYQCTAGSLELIPGATGQTFTPPATGNYAVVLSVAGCASDTSACQSVIVGVQESAFPGPVTVFPNPSSEIVNISFSQQQEELTVELYTPAGQLLQRRHWQQVSDVSFETSAPAGVYFLKVTNGYRQGVVRLMIE